MKKWCLSWSLLLALLISSLLIAGCGKSNEEKAKDAAIQKYKTCSKELGDFVNSLETLQSEVTIGLNYDQYSTEVTNLKVEFDQIETGSIGNDCNDNVSVPVEDAVNSYIDAYKTWNNCVESYFCTTDSIKFKVQSFWTDADVSIANAKDNLKGLRNPDYQPEDNSSVGSSI